jgi:hypothetical protein
MWLTSQRADWEKTREFDLETHLAFIDFKKAFNKADKIILRNILVARGDTHDLTKWIQSLHKKKTNIAIHSKGQKNEIVMNQGVREDVVYPRIFYIIYIIICIYWTYSKELDK